MEELDEPPDNSHRIGQTAFIHAHGIEPLIRCRRLYLKFEGSNPSGTQKDRASLACLAMAREMGYDSLAIGTCGNFGASFAHLARDFGIKTHVYIPSNYHTERIGEIVGMGGIVHRVEGTYEDAIGVVAVEAKDNGWYNANPGEELNTRVALEGYSGIAREIFVSLGHVPDVVAVPAGNGTTIAGVYHGFKVLYDEGKADRVPRMIAASTPMGNPIVRSFLNGLRTIRDLSPMEIKETSVNEPLVSWHSFDGQLALDALWESGGWATYVPDQKMIEFSKILAREEGLLVLPASASALAAVDGYLRHNPEATGVESCVAVLTARKPVPRRH